MSNSKWHSKRQASKLSIMSGKGCSKVCIWIAWGNKRAWEKKTQSKAHLKAVPEFPHKNRGPSEQQALLPHQPLWSLWSSSAKSLNWVQSVAQEMRRWNLSPVIDQQQVEIHHLPLPQSSSLVPIMTSGGIATSSYSCLITLPCFPPNWTRSTRKLVPPRSTA